MAQGIGTLVGEPLSLNVQTLAFAAAAAAIAALISFEKPICGQ